MKRLIALVVTLVLVVHVVLTFTNDSYGTFVFAIGAVFPHNNNDISAIADVLLYGISSVGAVLAVVTGAGTYLVFSTRKTHLN